MDYAAFRMLKLMERERAGPDSLETYFIEDFRGVGVGPWNDGLGSASRDPNMWFNSGPTLKLDTQGQSGSGSSPGRTAATSGVVFKRRMIDNFSGVFGLDLYFRFTGTSLTSATYPCMSVYNRDGASAWHGRLWLNPNGNNSSMKASILDGVATPAANGGSPLTGTTSVYADVGLVEKQYAAGSHLYDPSVGSGRGDKAGAWHHARLVVDLDRKKYVSYTLDSIVNANISSYSLDQTTTSGAAMMHFSFEFMCTTSTRRYMHIAQFRGLRGFRDYVN